MQATLYIADDIQSLVDGKTLMVGVYTDRVLIVNVPPDSIETMKAGTPIGLPSLSLMLTITEIEPGEHVCVPHIKSPDNKIQPLNGNLAPISVLPGGAANLLFKFQPFLISGAGKYTITAEIDKESIGADFEVRIAPIKG